VSQSSTDWQIIRLFFQPLPSTIFLVFSQKIPRRNANKFNIVACQRDIAKLQVRCYNLADRPTQRTELVLQSITCTYQLSCHVSAKRHSWFRWVSDLVEPNSFIRPVTFPAVRATQMRTHLEWMQLRTLRQVSDADFADISGCEDGRLNVDAVRTAGSPLTSKRHHSTVLANWRRLKLYTICSVMIVNQLHWHALSLLVTQAHLNVSWTTNVTPVM